MVDHDTSENVATHVTEAYIDGHGVTVETAGPEAQDLPDDADRIGADVLIVKIESALADLKAEVETGGD